MDRSEIEQLVERLVDNPHDEEALQYAHQAGEADPKAYAQLLEKVAADTKDSAYAAHWLSEAANVWSSALGDAHRAARLLMMAIDFPRFTIVAMFFLLGFAVFFILWLGAYFQFPLMTAVRHLMAGRRDAIWRQT